LLYGWRSVLIYSFCITNTKFLQRGGLKHAPCAPIRRFATNFDRLDRFFLPFCFFISRVSFSLSLSLSLSLLLWSFVFLFSFFHAIPLSLLPLPIPRYSQTLLTDETRFVLNFLDRTFRIAFKFARFATRVSLYSICICMYRLSILINIAERRRTRAIRFLDSAKFPNLLTPTSTATHISVMESTFFSYLLIFRYLAPNNFLA